MGGMNYYNAKTSKSAYFACACVSAHLALLV